MEEVGPKIVTQIPGPKSQELMKLRNEYVPQGVSTAHSIFIKEARGPFIEDVDGNIYIDFFSGIGVMNVGHRNPRVINAIKQQVEKYTHTCFMVVPYEPYVTLAKKLAEMAPGDLNTAMFVNSGAEAVENAVKIARYYTKKSNIITFSNAFHGRTLLAMALTSKVKPYKFGFGPFALGIFRVPYAYCYRCLFNLEYPSCGFECVEYIRNFLTVEVPPEETAALIVEPVQGEGGFIVPPVEYLKHLRKLCDEFGITMIVDEIQTGFGRTGKMFAVEHSGIVPDIMTLAKAIAAGMPLAAVIGKKEIMNSVHPGGIGGTYGGNPAACAAAMKVVDIIKESLPNAEKIGKLLMKRCQEFYDKYEVIGDVRGLGLMIGLEFVKNRESKEPNKEIVPQIIQGCAKKGLLVIKAGIYDNVLRFLPPITIDEEVAEKAMDILDETLCEVTEN